MEDLFGLDRLEPGLNPVLDQSSPQAHFTALDMDLDQSTQLFSYWLYSDSLILRVSQRNETLSSMQMSLGFTSTSLSNAIPRTALLHVFVKCHCYKTTILLENYYKKFKFRQLY